MKKLVTLICIVSCILTMAACSKEEQQQNETSTLTGMVILVEGTEIEIVEISSQNIGNPSGNFGSGNFNPENFENFNPENFNFENFDPENMPDGMPEGMPDMADGEFNLENMPQRPEGSAPPDFQMPEGSARPDFSKQMENMESKKINIKDAHISVEIDGGKAEGSIEDITTGAFVTVTLDKDGNATNVLVSQRTQMGNRPYGNGKTAD